MCRSRGVRHSTGKARATRGCCEPVRRCHFTVHAQPLDQNKALSHKGHLCKVLVGPANSIQFPFGSMAQQPSASITQAVRRIQQSFRRAKPDAARPDTGRSADSQPTTSGRSETFFLNCQTGETKPSYGCCQLRYTQASYQARDPVRDDTVLVVRFQLRAASLVLASRLAP